MVIKVYVSGTSGNKEVKKRQQRVQLILDSKNIKYDVVDIAEPENEEEKDFMQNNSTSNGATISDPNPRHPLPPQMFNDDQYCGDYDQFDMANEIDEMEKFLKLAPDDSAPTVTSNAEIKLGNGNTEPSKEEDAPATEETEESKEEKPEESAEDNNVPKSEDNKDDEETKNEEESKTEEETKEEEPSEENQTDEQKLENGNHDKTEDASGDQADDTTEKADES